MEVSVTYKDLATCKLSILQWKATYEQHKLYLICFFFKGHRLGQVGKRVDLEEVERGDQFDENMWYTNFKNVIKVSN